MFYNTSEPVHEILVSVCYHIYISSACLIQRYIQFLSHLTLVLLGPGMRIISVTVWAKHKLS